VVEKKSRKIICTDFCNGKKHDIKLFKQSNVHPIANIKLLVDSGYAGIDKIHKNTKLPIKRKKTEKSLTKEIKKFNKDLSSQRVVNENVIGFVKRFKIISDRYRNRRKRFGLRFNLIAGFCNEDIKE
jgi:hypothetical protein